MKSRRKSVCLFLGPSLSARSARQLWSLRGAPATLLIAPPIRQGDLVRLLHGDLDIAAVGIVDGVLRSSPAVSHKEILWAISLGIPVAGAASMGALRAAECERYGMLGVGRVFEDYRDGLLEDDDEVVLAHEFCPAEGRYTRLSEPLCNIRYTLERAINEEIIAATTRDAALEHLRRRPFWQRSLRACVDYLRDFADGAAEGAALADWLTTGHAYVDQKKLDAMTLVDSLAAIAESPRGNAERDWKFHTTYTWQLLCERAMVRADSAPSPER